MTKTEHDELVKLLRFPVELASSYFGESEEGYNREYLQMQKEVNRIWELVAKIKHED